MRIVNTPLKVIYHLTSLLALASCSKSHENKIGSSEITNWKDDKVAAISITYDDATINQFRKALPIMDSLQFKGTFFINTADIPESKFPPKYFGKPLQQIVDESNTADPRKQFV